MLAFYQKDFLGKEMGYELQQQKFGLVGLGLGRGNHPEIPEQEARLESFKRIPKKLMSTPPWHQGGKRRGTGAVWS